MSPTSTMKWFTIQLAPSWERTSETEWRATEGQIPEGDRRLAAKACFTVAVQDVDREAAIMQARRIHGLQKLQANIQKEDP